MFYLLSFEYSNAEYKREEKLIFLKKRSTDVSVDAVGEVIIQVLYSLVKVGCRLAVVNRL